MDKQTLLAFTGKPTAVEIPELGTVHLRQWTVKEREQFVRQTKKGEEVVFADVAPYVLRWSLCDSLGKPILTDDDLPAIPNLPAAIVDRIVTESLRYNGLTKDAEEDAEKNSVKAGSS